MAVRRINLGPVHPGTHGALNLAVDADGDIVKRVEPHIGLLHRGVEKLAESRLYMQSPAYMAKLDYVAPLGWSDLFVSAVEKATGTHVKERAQYARMVLLEFQRMASHLLWLGTFCSGIKKESPAAASAFGDRERLVSFLESATGGRTFHANLRLGGLDRELPQGFKEEGLKLADHMEDRVHRYRTLLDDSPEFMERTRNVGVLKLDDAIGLGVSGPVLRGSGLAEDARKSKPYYFYGKVTFAVPVQSRADCLGRYRVRMEEIRESARIVRQVLDMMPEKGDVKGLPVSLDGPDADPEPVLVSRELPRGEGMVYMVPGKQRPHRLSLRSPSFANLSALPKMCEGARLSDIPTILGSLDIVVSEIDR